MLIQLLANGLVNGCLYALVAIGFALIYNTTKIFHVAHGAIYTVGAYICYFFMVEKGWPLAVAVGIAVGCSGLLGALVEAWIYAPLARRGAPLLVSLLSSLGLYVALVNVIAMFFGNQTRVLWPGVQRTYSIVGVTLTRPQFWQVAAAAIIVPGLVLFLKFTNWGRIIRAVRDNPTLAMVMGINQESVRLWVFVVGSAVTALASILVALDVGVDPNVGMPMLLTAAVALIVGGVGTFEGPVVGGFILGVLQGLVVWEISARWMDAVTFGVLIVFLLFRPWGLAGRRRRIEETLE